MPLDETTVSNKESASALKLAARALLHGVEKSDVEIVGPQRNLLLDRQNVAQSPRLKHNSSSPKMEVTITQMRKFVNVPKIHPTTGVYIPPATSKVLVHH